MARAGREEQRRLRVTWGRARGWACRMATPYGAHRHRGPRNRIVPTNHRDFVPRDTRMQSAADCPDGACHVGCRWNQALVAVAAAGAGGTGDFRCAEWEARADRPNLATNQAPRGPTVITCNHMVSKARIVANRQFPRNAVSKSLLESSAATGRGRDSGRTWSTGGPCGSATPSKVGHCGQGDARRTRRNQLLEAPTPTRFDDEVWEWP